MPNIQVFDQVVRVLIVIHSSTVRLALVLKVGPMLTEA